MNLVYGKYLEGDLYCSVGFLKVAWNSISKYSGLHTTMFAKLEPFLALLFILRGEKLPLRGRKTEQTDQKQFQIFSILQNF